jgi:hypothetical protein
MGLPTSQGANPITYRLDHRSSGKRLSEEDSLGDAGVVEDDIDDDLDAGGVERLGQALEAISS